MVLLLLLPSFLYSMNPLECDLKGFLRVAIFRISVLVLAHELPIETQQLIGFAMMILLFSLLPLRDISFVVS